MTELTDIRNLFKFYHFLIYSILYGNSEFISTCCCQYNSPLVLSTNSCKINDFPFGEQPAHRHWHNRGQCPVGQYPWLCQFAIWLIIISYSSLCSCRWLKGWRFNLDFLFNSFIFENLYMSTSLPLLLLPYNYSPCTLP